MIRTNIELDEVLVDEGLKLTHCETKKQLINYALAELVKRIKRKGVLKFEGKVKWEGNLDEMRLSS